VRVRARPRAYAYVRRVARICSMYLVKRTWQGRHLFATLVSRVAMGAVWTAKDRLESETKKGGTVIHRLISLTYTGALGPHTPGAHHTQLEDLEKAWNVHPVFKSNLSKTLKSLNLDKAGKGQDFYHLARIRYDFEQSCGRCQQPINTERCVCACAHRSFYFSLAIPIDNSFLSLFQIRVPQHKLHKVR
jgi:hypothetical protein